MNLINFILLLILYAFLSFPSAEALTLEDEKKYDELEGVEFLKALVSDKKYHDTIEQFQAALEKSSRKGHLYYYLAMAHYELKQFKLAHKALESGASFSKPVQYFALWANNFYHLKSFKQCSSSFQKMPLEEIRPIDWTVYFECLVKSENNKTAISLALTNRIHDEDFFVVSQKTLITHELHSLALERREKFLDICRSPEFYLRLWAVVEKLKPNSISVLELGHACHPKSLEITSQLVKNLFVLGQYHTIAFLFESLSNYEKEYFKHAAEFYQVAGRNTVANYFFILGDEKDYLMARSSFFLRQENYAALLTIPFKSSTLLKNTDLSYAIAYSHFKYLNLPASLSTLESAGRSSRGEQLTKLIDQCRDLDWRCRP